MNRVTTMIAATRSRSKSNLKLTTNERKSRVFLREASQAANVTRNRATKRCVVADEENAARKRNQRLGAKGVVVESRLEWTLLASIRDVR